MHKPRSCFVIRLKIQCKTLLITCTVGTAMVPLSQSTENWSVTSGCSDSPLTSSTRHFPESEMKLLAPAYSLVFPHLGRLQMLSLSTVWQPQDFLLCVRNWSRCWRSALTIMNKDQICSVVHPHWRLFVLCTALHKRWCCECKSHQRINSFRNNTTQPQSHWGHS